MARGWGGGKETRVSEQQVAVALGDGSAQSEAFSAASLPAIPPPRHVRPCCAFGMDLQVSLGGKRVPGYSTSNIIGVADLGRHEYDNGPVTLNQDLARLVTVEKNGLVYTCRGGFVDTAHVRDNADTTLFLTMQIVAALPGPTIVTIDGDGATKRVVLKAVPPELMDPLGRWEVAIMLAQWASFQLSIWHEIVTWYGYESFPGFSEKVSAFSLEDLYSNALGARIAGGLLRNQRVRTRADWDDLVPAWIAASLQRLGALSSDLGRRAMKSVDGRWWDSSKQLPDWTLVTHRNFELGPRVEPWRLSDVDLPADPVLAAACSQSPAALPLEIPEHIGRTAIRDLVSLDFEVKPWAPASFPFADAKARRVTNADFARIVETIRREAQQTFGAGFDRPGEKAH
ncbi:Hypothetical protein A7982_07184 [Minicystis rosea]|nr:Hypothetical protein A7982_07184 [Minicystis rosea]